jgi:hypothetical protein
VGLERADNLEGWGHDVDGSIVSTKEEVIGACTEASNFILEWQDGQLEATQSDWRRRRTLKTDELSSGSLTCEASKKLNVFHLFH